MVTKTALTDYIDQQRSDRKYKAWRKSRINSVGASEIGLCERKVFWIKQGDEGDHIDPDYVEGWGAAQRGVSFEKGMWVPALRKKYGDKLLFSGAQQKTWRAGNLSATPDGILIQQPKNVLADLFVPDIGPSRTLVLDCKTIDPRMRLEGPKPEHEFQVQVQMGILREVSEYKPDYAVLAYINASFFDDVVEFAIKFDPEVFAVAKRRTNRILGANQPSDLKPEGWIAGGDECRYCRFAKACGTLRRAVPDVEKGKLDSQFEAELLDLVKEEKHYRSLAADAETRQRDVQYRIKERLKEKSLRVVKSDCIEVVWSTVVGRPAYDMPKIKSALETAGLSLEQYTRVGEPTDRLLLKLKR